MDAKKISTFLLSVLFFCLVFCTQSRSESENEFKKDRRWWMIGGQFTGIGQVNTPVSGDYFNPDISFGHGSHFGWSGSVSLFGAVTPWKGGVLMLEPEYANGRGMPNASGLAGYPNGEIVRTGALGRFPPPYIARGFYHQDFAWGPGESGEAPEFEDRFMPSGAHHFSGVDTPSRIELTVGKFAATDFFDSSEIATDPRHHFMNWALMQQGAWDAAADTRGYTYGLVLGLEKPRFAVRGGLLLMPKEANGQSLDWNVARSREEIVEGEYRYTLLGRRGTIKALVFVNHAHMGNYNDAISSAPAGAAPDITSVRRRGAIKFGGGILMDQEVLEGLKTFLRVGANDGQTETFAFTEIDRSVSLGADMSGKYWRRPEDHLALAVAFSGLSGAHARYLSDGGVGFQLGDGRLHDAWETIVECYYLLAVNRYLAVTADAQGIFNPGMNSDHGPTGIFGLRLHGHL